MFELTIAFRYLIPRKKRLSRSLISLVSLFVISLVVWLVIVFLSVTEGLENKWLENLVSLHAPARMTPSDNYYQSYDCLVDRYSLASDYQTLSLEEKRNQKKLPYDPDVDPELPQRFPDTRQLIRPTYELLQTLGNEEGFDFETFHYGYGQIELNLSSGKKKGRSLKSTSIVHSFSEHNPFFFKTLSTPSKEEIKSLLLDRGKVSLPELTQITENISIQPRQLINDRCIISPHKIDLLEPVTVSYFPSKKIRSLFITDDEIPGTERATLKRTHGTYDLHSFHELLPLDPSFSITIINPASIEASKSNHIFIENREAIADVSFRFSKNKSIDASIPISFMDYDITEVKRHFTSLPSSEPLWAYFVHDHDKAQSYIPSSKEHGQGVLLASTLMDQGVSIGDTGTLSYKSYSGGANNELKNHIFVAGFYDSGIGGLGSKLIFAPKDYVRSMVINQDLLENEGIFLWTKEIKSTDRIKNKVSKALSDLDLSPYWNIETYKTYDFSKDFVEQLQSDRLLLTLIAGIILLVAGSNIISMLLLLIHDKKSEIGILRALGAKPRSIALTFGFCGLFIGFISAFIGTAFAYITLANIDLLASILSSVQGHDIFNTAFYGKNLPDAMSFSVVSKIWIMTMIISFTAGVLPAIKACALTPSQILRNDAS